LGEIHVIHRLQVVTTSHNPFMGCRWTHTLSNHKIGNKLADLHMFGSSARERGSFGPAMATPIFNKLPRYASEPPHVAQSLNHLDRPSAYDHGRSAYPTGRSAYLTGRSGTGLIEEDCYLNPRPSQQHFPSHYTMHRPINTESQAHGG
jgi:hypothetical protein